jgi:hypothetical protein
VLALNATIGRLRHKWLIQTKPQNKFPKCSGLQANLADRRGALAAYIAEILE